MKNVLKELSWKQIVAALAALGIITTSDPDSAVISLAAMVVVALFGLASKAMTEPIGREWLSITVYLTALALSIASDPPAAGLLVWQGDAAEFVSRLASILSEFSTYALAVTGSATILYNAILKIVVDEIEGKLGVG